MMGRPHTKDELGNLTAPAWAVKRGYLVPTLRKDGRIGWGNGVGQKWAAWTEYADRRLIELYKKGVTYKVIAHDLKVSQEQLQRRIEHHKLPNTSPLRKTATGGKRPRFAIALNKEDLSKLRRRAAEAGMSLANYTRLLIRRDLGG